LGFNPGAVKWSRRQPSTLYILQEGKLNRWDFKKKEIQPTALEKVADFQPTSFGLLWLQAGSNMLFQSDEEGKTAVRQNRLKNFKKKPPLLWVSSAKPFLSFEPEKWAALDKAGNFYVLNPSFYHAGVRGARFSPSGGKILFWTKDEIWLLEEESAEGGKEAPAKFKRRLVYESAVPILNAFWSSDENYAFFLTHRKLFVLELDPEGGANFYPYYSSKNSFFPKGWAVDEADGLFYFVADLKETRKLRVLRLAVGFLEPLVDHVEQMRKDVTAWTEKFQK
jgi:hypothetical protein